ncbi:hypothetical protein BGZ83_011824, partial [Gryganskiella cystojenkinii]
YAPAHVPPQMNAGPLPATVPIVVASSWQPNPNNVLTYTSYAGLLTTLAPSFYPSASPTNLVPISVAPPAEAPTPFSQSPVSPPLPTPASAPTSIETWTPVPIWVSGTSAVSSSRSSVTPTAPTNSQSTSSSVRSSQNENNSHSSSSSDSVDSASAQSTTVTPTTTDVTVSTITTTGVDSTTTTTSVGSDGTTTVLTEIPSSTSTRSHSTSGAETRRTRPDAFKPTIGLIFHQLLEMVVPSQAWSCSDYPQVAVVLATFVSSVMVLMA